MARTRFFRRISMCTESFRARSLFFEWATSPFARAEVNKALRVKGTVLLLCAFCASEETFSLTRTPPVGTEIFATRARLNSYTAGVTASTGGRRGMSTPVVETHLCCPDRAKSYAATLRYFALPTASSRMAPLQSDWGRARVPPHLAWPMQFLPPTNPQRGSVRHRFVFCSCCGRIRPRDGQP